MVKKFVFNINGHYIDNNATELKETELMKMNDVIHHQLTIQKNAISSFHKTRKWDKYKKLTNSYELVFTSTQGCPSIAQRNPISRSFFKLWEILHDFKEEIGLPDVPITSVFLADAPGGFGEAYIDYRKQCCSFKDELYGMSLKATNKIIPDWKFNDQYCQENNLKLFYGQTGTGNIYDINNIHELVDKVGNNNCFFITADGGFDFSVDFNSQEDMSLRLILCEIYSALKMQKNGGTFVLKIYDIHNKVTMKLLYILKRFYNSMYFVKPLSSRPANSEKYVICTGFHIASIDHHEKVLSMLKLQITQFDVNKVLTTCELPISFVADIINYNRVFIANQALHIAKTLMLIDNLNEYITNEIVKNQVKKALKWCHKYNIDISIPALHKYRNMYSAQITTVS